MLIRRFIIGYRPWAHCCLPFTGEGRLRDKIRDTHHNAGRPSPRNLGGGADSHAAWWVIIGADSPKNSPSKDPARSKACLVNKLRRALL
jgi:hypothetical protein